MYPRMVYSNHGQHILYMTQLTTKELNNFKQLPKLIELKFISTISLAYSYMPKVISDLTKHVQL